MSENERKGRYRIEIAYFELEADERGYLKEVNKEKVLDVCVTDSAPGIVALREHVKFFASTFVPGEKG